MMKFAQALRRMRKEEKGFTLIELMVVVVIIGVLAAVAVPKISSIVAQSKVNADIATGKTLQDAIDRYQQNNNAYPATIAALAASTNGGPYIAAAVPKVQQQVAGATVPVLEGAGSVADATHPIAYNLTTGAISVYSVTGAAPVWP